MAEIWTTDLYRETAAIILGFLILLALGIFFVRKRSTHLQASWASVKSWIFTVPILLVVLALKEPWPLVCMTILAIYGAKIFFQMTGMYHRTYFVWTCYAGVVALGLSIHYKLHTLYQVMPMIVLGLSSLIPIARNSAKKMVQYISLTLVAFSFIWGFMHIGWIWYWPKGPYIVLYILILTELCDTLYINASRFFIRVRLFHKITQNRSLEGFFISLLFTTALAWGMRHLLPERSELFWVTSAVIITFAGSLGDLSLALLRRDMGIKDVGSFIIGRSDLLSRMDRFIFVCPIYYYVFVHLLEA